MPLPLFLIVVLLGSPPSPAPPVAAARAHVAAHGPAIVRSLAELLEIPCVADDLEGTTRTARWIARAFAGRGAEMNVVGRDGVPPLVVGRLDATEAPESARTLGVYVHYDGQPVDPTEWTFGPWTPTLTTKALEAGGVARPLPEDGEPIDPEARLYARASGDDKAPLVALLAAIDALEAAGLPRRSNLVFLFEGEEEAGSPHLGDYLDDPRVRPWLDADLWLICDGPCHQSRRPQLVFGVRGITGFELTVYGASRHLHSGHYGNWAPNPGHRLARLLASMKDDDGRVLVDGFLDGVLPPGEAVARAAATIPPFEDALRAELGLKESEAGDAPYLERMLLPSLNVRGLKSATVGRTARNVIPTTATASIDVRLVKGQDPAAVRERIRRHVEERGYLVLDRDPTDAERLAHARIAKMTGAGGYRAVQTSLDHPQAEWLIETTRLAAGDDLVLMPILGGSLPLWLFEEKLGVPLVIVPIANHDDNQHAPDENLRLGNLWYGVELMAAIAATR